MGYGCLLDFTVLCQLIRHVRLVSGFCSSGYDFAIPSSRHTSRCKPWELLWGSSATTSLVDFHHRLTACPSYHKKAGYPARISEYSVINNYSPSPFTHSGRRGSCKRDHCLAREVIRINECISVTLIFFLILRNVHLHGLYKCFCMLYLDSRFLL